MTHLAIGNVNDEPREEDNFLLIGSQIIAMKSSCNDINHNQVLCSCHLVVSSGEVCGGGNSKVRVKQMEGWDGCDGRRMKCKLMMMTMIRMSRNDRNEFEKIPQDCMMMMGLQTWRKEKCHLRTFFTLSGPTTFIAHSLYSLKWVKWVLHVMLDTQ